MVGDGIRADFTATKSDEEVEVSADDAELVDQALANYGAYVEDQTDQLVAKTQEFVDLYKSGDDDAARALYAVARTHWERIETVAESFGDLDPMMDAREADLAPGDKWTGWHRIEKDLWPERAEGYQPLSAKGRAKFADDLMANTDELATRVPDLTYTVDQIANGSRGLLDEVATGKVTGEEEYWSRTDLYDFQANVDGARVAFEGVQPIVEKNDPELAEQIADPLRRAPGAARRDARGRRLRVLRRALRGPGQAALRRRQRPQRAALEARRGSSRDHHVRSLTPRPARWHRCRWGRRGGGRFRRRLGGAGWRTRPPRSAPTTFELYGDHQAGIVTPVQDRLHFAAFDVITDDREALVGLLQAWTAAAAEMMAGRPAGPRHVDVQQRRRTTRGRPTACRRAA